MLDVAVDTNKDMELLCKIFRYGGYTTTFAVKAYLQGYTFRAVQYMLKRLTDKGWLEQIPFYSSSRRFPIVYKVTGKACNYFDEPGSYLKRRHTDLFIIRSLIRQHFVFELLGQFEKNIVSNAEAKIKLLGIESQEFLIDFTEDTESRGVISRDGEIILSSSPGKVVVTYVDKSTKNPASQLQNLVKRYDGITVGEGTNVDFLIVVDLKRRENSYLKLIENYESELQRNNFGIPDEVIRLHIKLLVEKLRIDPTAVAGFEEKVREKFKDIPCFEASDEDRLIVKAIQEMGIKAVGKMAMELLNAETDLERKRDRIKELFQKIYRLYSAGYFSKESEHKIMVYRIGYTYSVTV